MLDCKSATNGLFRRVARGMPAQIITYVAWLLQERKTMSPASFTIKLHNRRPYAPSLQNPAGPASASPLKCQRIDTNTTDRPEDKKSLHCLLQDSAPDG